MTFDDIVVLSFDIFEYFCASIWYVNLPNIFLSGDDLWEGVVGILEKGLIWSYTSICASLLVSIFASFHGEGFG